MRVSQNAMMRNYTRSMHRTLTERALSNERLTTQRSFHKVSESPSTAARAFAVRSQYARNQESLKAIDQAASRMAAAESNINNVNQIMVNVKESLMRGLNETLPEEQLEILAREIEGLNLQVLQFANAQFGGQYLFGGSNNQEAPFQMEGGRVLYNGIDPDLVRFNTSTGRLEHKVSHEPDVFEQVPKNKSIYLDVGLGLTMEENGSIDHRSAFKVSGSGLDVFGFGTVDVEGTQLSQNLNNLLVQLADAVRNGDRETIGKGLTLIDASTKALVMEMTDIGSREGFLNQIKARLETENINLQETQKKLEGVDIEAETIRNKTYETAWLISLQLGSRIIPPSIFDFMR